MYRQYNGLPLDGHFKEGLDTDGHYIQVTVQWTPSNLASFLGPVKQRRSNTIEI